MERRYWFRPKSFGYGATPTTWEGWAVTLGSALVTNVGILAAVAAEALRWPHRHLILAAGLALALVSLVVTIVVARAKTDGEWRWRG